MIHLNDEEVLNIATPIMDNLMEASTRKDYKAHTKDFSTYIKENFSKEEFLVQCKEYQEKWGHFSKRTFMGITRQNACVTLYWKQGFTKSDDEFLALLTLAEDDHGYVVERAFVDLWDIEA